MHEMGKTEQDRARRFGISCLSFGFLCGGQTAFGAPGRKFGPGNSHRSKCSSDLGATITGSTFYSYAVT